MRNWLRTRNRIQKKKYLFTNVVVKFTVINLISSLRTFYHIINTCIHSTNQEMESLKYQKVLHMMKREKKSLIKTREWNRMRVWRKGKIRRWKMIIEWKIVSIKDNLLNRTRNARTEPTFKVCSISFPRLNKSHNQNSSKLSTISTTKLQII